MNLIVDEQKLDRQQERAIYELTLKKQRSKKSTVSRKQVAAMQQLANELLALRKSSLEMLDLNQDNCTTNLSTSQRRYPSFRTTICRCHSVSVLVDTEAAKPALSEEVAIKECRRDTLTQATLGEPSESSPELARADESALTSSPSDSTDRTPSTLVASSAASTPAVTKQQQQQHVHNNNNHHHHHHHHYKAAKELQRQSSTSTIATTSTSTSVSSSSSCASTSSSAVERHHDGRHGHSCQTILNSSFISSTNSATSISDATSIKLSQLRLEQLNNELERRLHQYEYLVAQEKAILGSYNMNLFANESVNNFHLFARLDQKNTL